MRRSDRQFRSQLLELEGRWLLSTAVAPTHLYKDWEKTLEFVNSNGVALNYLQPIQVATQQDGAAIVNLHRSAVLKRGEWSEYPTTPSLPFQQVRVTTVPSSGASFTPPSVGVNVAHVDQIVTFAPGQTDASVSVPILAGAPNPGEVDVPLTVTPIDPTPADDSASIRGGFISLNLKIGASEAQVPPSIVAMHRTRGGVALTFDKPMDPAGASNVHNYHVNSFNPANSGDDRVYKIKAARYDPATDTVTLVAPGAPGALLLTVSNSGSRRSRRQVGPPLADVEGNRIIDGFNPPGQFSVSELELF
jgi:hypothetical protein